MSKSIIDLKKVAELFSDNKLFVIGFEISANPTFIESTKEKGKQSLGYEVYCYRKQDSKVLGKLIINVEDLFSE